MVLSELGTSTCRERARDLLARALLPGSVGSIAWTRPEVLRVASHGGENGFRPVAYRFAVHAGTA